MRRNIFPFRDGSRNWLGFRRARYADPLVIARGLDRHPKFLADEHLAAILKYRDGSRSTDTAQARAGMHEAVEIAAGAVRDVFGVKPLDKGGLTDMECVDLLIGFMGWLNGVKKNTVPSPTAAPPTDATSSESSEPTTNATSPSSSCDPGSAGDGLTKSEEASSKPSETPT